MNAFRPREMRCDAEDECLAGSTGTMARWQHGFAMPGIAGIISHSGPSDNSRLVATMLESMMHERFYESAMCAAPELGVSAGVIAHPGSFAARGSNAGAEDAVNLLAAGECFQDESILSLYDRLGDPFVGRLNGLFSGLIVDRRRQRAL